MIAFFVVTALINLAIGFALAHYLGQASASAVGAGLQEELLAPPTAAPANEPPPVEAVLQDPTSATAEQRRSAERNAVWTAEDDLAGGEVEHADRPVAKTQAATGLEPLETASVTVAAAPEVEQDLLAGIEEFRNQLAKLKEHEPAGPAGVK